jgi:elongation factor 1 alpha-like protein
VCVAINKLDINDWSESRYDELIKQIVPYMITVGYKEDKIQFVPVSALKGINLSTRDLQPEQLKSWYNE